MQTGFPRSAQASNLSPADGAIHEAKWATLKCRPGGCAVSHDVYIGANFDDVNDGAEGTFLGNQTTTTLILGFPGFPAPDGLVPGTTYYWRIDEVNEVNPDSPWKGDVWSFRTLPVVPISDPDLIGWWTFDEGVGDIALDWSGHGNDGILINGPQWVRGYMNRALEFDGSNYVIIDGVSDNITSNDITLSGWVKTIQQDNNWFSCNTATGGNVFFWAIKSGGRAAIRPAPYESLSTTVISDGEWHMLTFVRSGSTGYIFVDGVQENSQMVDFNFSIDNRWSIGQEWDAGTPSNFLTGTVDNVRIYNKGLTVEEIKLVMRGNPSLAWAPSPPDGSMPDIDNAIPLSWSAGDSASSHDVYFGTDADAVKHAATSDTFGIYRGRQNVASFTPAEGIEWGGGPYYWRIDENNTDGTVAKGRVWSFTVADFILVDDLESYTDDDATGKAIWQHCIDGFDAPANGSQVGNLLPPYTEQTIVHGGRQSMPLVYDNAGGVRNSEAVLELTAARDWTIHGVGFLSLWLRGYPPAVGGFSEGPVGTFRMTASGADISRSADQLHFACKTLSGPGTIVARVDSVQNTNAWAKAGVMIRETLDAGSKHAFAAVTPGQGVTSQGRTDTNSSSFSTNQTGITAPHWVKLERDAAGNFTVSHSSNGSIWEPVGSAIPTNIPMTSDVYVGLALTSHDNTQTCEARFSNVTITGSVGQQWSHQDVGILANNTEPIYVSLSDSTGASATVVNDDPAASTLDT